MFEKDAEEIARDIYIHHFDDDVNYPYVLQAITIGVQKGAEFGERQSEKRIAELKKQIEKMKCCYNCKKWNNGECSESPEVYTMADFECETWELKE